MSHIALSLPPLVKPTSKGKVRTWRCWVEEREDGAGIVNIEHGEVGGKLQLKREIVTKGKYLGKKNATTPLTQAIADARSRWSHQINSECYGETIEQSQFAIDRAPMLAHMYYNHKYDNRHKVDWTCAYEQPKKDGWRLEMICEGGELVLRSRENGINPLLPHITEPMRGLLEEGDILDGELYAHGISVTSIGSLITREREESKQLQFNVFDFTRVGGLDLPFSERYTIVQQKLTIRGRGASVLPVPTTKITGEDQLYQLFRRRLDEGLEGSILRHGKTGYEPDARSMSLLKVKNTLSQEFEIVGVREGDSTDYAGVAIFVCKTPAGHEFDVVSHGSMPEKRAHWENREAAIGRKLRVDFANWTDTEQPKPFQPRSMGFRDGKPDA